MHHPSIAVELFRTFSVVTSFLALSVLGLFFLPLLCLYYCIARVKSH